MTDLIKKQSPYRKNIYITYKEGLIQMSLQKKFLEFNKNIHLTREDPVYSAARKKDDSILAKIKERFKEEGYPVIDNFIQGSLSTFTAIKDENEDFDIDRAIVIDADQAPDNPLKPKEIVLDILEKRGFENAKIKRPCVTADYKNDNLHIDIPIYKRDSHGNYQLAVGKSNSTKEWSDSDPIGLRDWINDFDMYFYYKDEHRDQFRRLVRYIKKWRNHQFSDFIKKNIFSIGLTVMFKRQFKPSINSEGIADDVQALRDTINAILFAGYFIPQGDNKYKIRIDLPVTPYRDIYDGKGSSESGTQLCNRLNRLVDKLNEVSDPSMDLSKQCRIMNKQFGDQFPSVAVTEESSTESNDSSNKFLSAGIVGTSQGA